MVDDAVDVVQIELLVDVGFFVIFRAHDEQIGVGFGHAVEGIGSFQGGEDPAAAIGRGQHVGAQAGKELGMGAQAAPDRHAIPVNAKALVVHGTFPVVHAFFQFSQQFFVELNSPGRSPAHHGGTHEGAAVEEGQGRGFGRRHSQDLFPCIGALAGEADNLFEFVDVEFVSRDLFQRGDQVLDLQGYTGYNGPGGLFDIDVAADPQHGSVEFTGVVSEPVLDVPALVGVEDQHIGFGNAVDAFVDFGQRRLLLHVCTDVGGHVGAHLG